jgi:hypothetical protein
MSEEKCASCEKIFSDKEMRYAIYLGNVSWGALCQKCFKQKQEENRLENIALSKYSSRLQTPN